MVEKIIDGMSPEEIEVMGRGINQSLSILGGFEIMAFCKNKPGCSLCSRASGH